MASIEAPAPPADMSRSHLSDIPSASTQEPQAIQSRHPSSAPIEMNSLSASCQSHPQYTSIFGPAAVPSDSTTNVSPSAMSEKRQNEGHTTQGTLNFDPQVRESLPSAPTNQASGPSPYPLTREQTAPAIGPATDKPTPITKDVTADGPVLFITLLLASTGARHPYKLDAKYMKKRNVEVEDNNPINMSMYKLKELILRDWRNEWDAKPSSPESIRLIFMGKMLNDKSRLAENGFTNGLTPQIVHMAIKPQEIVDEEEANKAIGKDREGNERSPGCRCVIQ